MPPNNPSSKAGDASPTTISAAQAATNGTARGPTDPEDDARREARVPLGVTTQLDDPNDIVGVLQNVSLGGAMLVTRCPAVPQTGAGLEVALRLPTGPQLRLSSTVRWSRIDEPAVHASSGLQFLNVSGPNRSYLQHYIELVAMSGTEVPMRTEVMPKYRVSFDAAGRAQAMLGGMLTREEAHAFASLLKQRVSARRMNRMHFAIDVRRLSVCSQEVVLEIKRCFEFLAERAEVFGFLIGVKSLALNQLVRAARDAGIADHIFCVNEPADARRIWEQMET